MPFHIQDDDYGFIMTDNENKSLEYETVDEALSEILEWFSQQSDTQSFTVIDAETKEPVGGHHRDDFEFEEDDDIDYQDGDDYTVPDDLDE